MLFTGRLGSDCRGLQPQESLVRRFFTFLPLGCGPEVQRRQVVRRTCIVEYAGPG